MIREAIDIRRPRRAATLALLACAGLGLAGAGPAGAATFTVETFNDQNPLLAGDGNCALREAVHAASTDTLVADCGTGDAGPTLDTIQIPFGGNAEILGLGLVGANDDTNASGDIDLVGSAGTDGPLTIIGTDNVDGRARIGASGDRGIHKLVGDTGLLTLDNIEVFNGSTSAQGATGEGGGIKVEGGPLTLTNDSLVFFNTSAEQGGGIAMVGSAGNLIVNDSTIRQNLTLLPSTLLAGGHGGGIYNDTSDTTISDSLITINQARRNHPATATQVVTGGGVAQDQGTLTITNSTFSGNGVDIAGNAADAGEGGAIKSSNANVAITASTFNGNLLTGGGTGVSPTWLRRGVAVQFTDTSGTRSLTVTRSTFSDNHDTPASDAAGGAIHAAGGDTTVRFVTSAGNSVGAGGDGASFFFDDLVQAGATFSVGGSLLYSSVGNDCDDDDAGVVGAEMGTAGGNVAQGSEPLCLAGGTDAVNNAVTLDPLALNGNPNGTETRALTVTTPVLNHMTEQTCINLIASPFLTNHVDQRGFPRAVGGGCEPGAFEVMECDGVAATITGTSVGDTIPTTAGNDVVVGGPGSDVIQASAGNDTICGDRSLASGDTIDYSTAPGSPAVVDLEAGTATLPAAKSDSLFGFENATGTAGDDTLSGSDSVAFPGTLDGGAGNDILNGRGGNDTLTGGTDNGGVGDLAVFDDAPGPVTVDLSVLASQPTGNGTDTIGGVESLRGTSGNDTLTGDVADNTLIGLAGDDTLSGGDGSDTADFSAAAGPVTVNLASANQQDTGAGLDTLATIENAIGTSAGDTFTGSSAANSIDAGAGTDTMSFAAGSAVVASTTSASGQGADTMSGVENLTGSSDDDTLSGDSGANVLDGADGSDTASYSGFAGPIAADLAADTITGQGTDSVPNTENVVGTPAADVLSGDGGNNSFTGGAGIDTVNFSVGGPAVIASLAAGTAAGQGGDTLAEVENLTGTNLADRLTGDGAANLLAAGGGNDIVSGGGSADQLRGAAGNDRLTGGAGNDRLLGAAGTDVLVGGAGKDVASGGPGADRASGAAGNDTLNGSTGNDKLSGGAGRDRLRGGAGGADNCNGGAGIDLKASGCETQVSIP